MQEIIKKYLKTILIIYKIYAKSKQRLIMSYYNIEGI